MSPGSGPRFLGPRLRDSGDLVLDAYPCYYILATKDVNLVGNCETEGDWLVWRINRITVQSVESRRQQFLSFSYKGFNGSWDRAQNFAFLEFETSSATVSGTRLRAIKIQSQKDPEEHEKLINYRFWELL